MACLDTSFLLDLAGRGGKKRQKRARWKVANFHASGEILTTTRFTIAELWVGVERSADPEKEQAAIEQLLKPLVILDFDQAGARTFGRLVACLQLEGLPIGDMDALIASVALVHAQSIVTDNTKHFENIPGILLENY